MNIFWDFLLIISTSIIAILSYKKIIYNRNSSIANYVILILYLFCVFPIILNYIFGIPKYNTIYWYKPFIEVMFNKDVNKIYDIYIMGCVISLYVLCARKKIKNELEEYNLLTFLISKSIIISIFLISLPIIYIILSGKWNYYTIYAVSSTRGLKGSNNLKFMTPCMLVSMITFFSITFKGKINIKKFIVLFLYSFVIIWISGKRFMLANILFLTVYYLLNMKLSKKIRKYMYIILPFLVSLVIFFSIFYLINIRPMTETSVSSIYDMLRVDFGRDDVIKYVINKEIIRHEHILEYYGETFISLIGSFVPRKIWLSKPYPHYMYLTGSILNLDIQNLPAGTTPSLLEMTICNFSYFGFFISIFLLILLCKCFDKIKDIDRKAISLILLIVLLTQSMDVYLILIVFFFIESFFVKFKI